MVELDSSAAGLGLSRATSSTSRPAASTGTSAARRRDDAAPTGYASSLVFTTRQRSPSGHLDGRGMSSPEISETGHTMPDMMDLGNKRALVRCARMSRPRRSRQGRCPRPLPAQDDDDCGGVHHRHPGSPRTSLPPPLLKTLALRRLYSGGRPTRRFAGCGTRRPPTHELSVALAVCSSFSD